MINSEFIIADELVELVPLKGSTIKIDILSAHHKYNLILKNLCQLQQMLLPQWMALRMDICPFRKKMSKKLVMSMKYLSSIVLFIKRPYAQNRLDLLMLQKFCKSSQLNFIPCVQSVAVPRSPDIN